MLTIKAFIKKRPLEACNPIPMLRKAVVPNTGHTIPLQSTFPNFKYTYSIITICFNAKPYSMMAVSLLEKQA